MDNELDMKVATSAKQGLDLLESLDEKNGSKICFRSFSGMGGPLFLNDILVNQEPLRFS